MAATMRLATRARPALASAVLSKTAAQQRAFSLSARRDAQWGFIGLGQMGYSMAKNLQSKLPATDTMHIFDINETATQKFALEIPAESGAAVRIASSVRDAAQHAYDLSGAVRKDTTITVLPEPVHVKTVYAEILREPLIAAPGSDRLFIDCSTIDPMTSKSVGSAVSNTQRGLFVDAPVSGGVVGAKAGTLTFMVGCPKSAVSRVEPILLMMGKRVLHCGDQGAGLSGKLANNYLLAINNIATAEAMNLGMKWGLDPKVLANLLNVSTGKCWPSEVNNPVKGVVEGSPASRGYEGGFGISLMKKDLGLAIAAAQEAGARLELGDRAQEVYTAATQDPTCKGRDFSVVYRFIGGAE